MRRPPKYVQAFIDRNGKPRFYFRRPGFKSVPLPDLPWSPQFMEVYEAALSGQPLQIGASRTKPGTVSAAIIGYYYDQSFLALAPSTQRPRRRILEHFRAEHGDKRIALLQRQHIITLLRSKKRFAARHWLMAIRALMKYAVEIGLYRVPEIVTRGRFPDGGESDSTWRTQEARHVGSDTIAPGF